MNARLLRVAKSSKWSSIALYVLFNQRAKRLAELDTYRQSKDVSVPKSVEYVLNAFQANLEHGGLSLAELSGKRVLELGPGDNLGLALRFLAAGSDVVTLDKYEVARDLQGEQAIYRALLERLPAHERERADLERLRPITGVGIEEAAGLLEAESFDLILSVAVLEHVYDPDAAFVTMDRLLKPGGLLLHQVDFRDHTMFTGGGQHPLTFLTVSPRVWKAITDRWAGPNRRLIDYYRSQTRALGYDTRLLVNQALGVEGDVPVRDFLSAGMEVSDVQRRLIEQIRPKLRPQFRHLADEDLVATGVFMVARKPSETRTRYSPSRRGSFAEP